MRSVLRVVRNVVVGLALFAIAAGLMWRGAGIVAVRMNRVEPPSLSFAGPGLTSRELMAANHVPAGRGGSFVRDALIGMSNVRGVRVWIGTEDGTESPSRVEAVGGR